MSRPELGALSDLSNARRGEASILVGCIADDFTGATDLAGMLTKAGLRTVQLIGVPKHPLSIDVEAVVIALKSRTCPPDEAIRHSLQALDYLRDKGAQQIYFKYCSTFDSTLEGNIGPVADALLDALGADFTILCPAFPRNGRTVYKGNLFVGDIPLAESGMRDHPLTPMTDSNLMRVMALQTQRHVGLISHEIVRQGQAAIKAQIGRLRSDGVTYGVVDTLTEADLLAIGAACGGMPLVTGGSGLAFGLRLGGTTALGGSKGVADTLPRTGGRRAVIAGSCSEATRRQIAAMQQDCPSFQIVAVEIAEGEAVVERAVAWAREQDGPFLIYATAPPNAVRAAQAEHGVAAIGGLIEDALGQIASRLIEQGVGQLIVAGGETSGAVVKALDVTGLVIGPEIDPGVPWTATLEPAGRQPLALALKSGNFGTDDFFLKAWSRLE